MYIKKYAVSCDPSVYEAWPDLVLTDSGKLICVFTECAHHLDRDKSRIVITESVSRGRSWSPKKALTDRGIKDCYYNCARISKLKDGRLVIICDKIFGHEDKASELHVWESKDDGATWNGPFILPFFGIVPDKIQELENGRVIVSAQFFNEETKKISQYLWYTDDKGKTWSDRITVAEDPRYFLCETSILNCGDGTLVAFLRENSHKGYDMMKVISHDYGETWSELIDTPMDCGHRPTSGFLKDGRVMVTYRFIPGGTQNMFAAFLTEAALATNRHQKVRILPVDYDRSSSPDCGYTGWVQFDDEEIYIVQYIKDDSDTAQIRGYSFYPDDVLFPAHENTSHSVFG